VFIVNLSGLWRAGGIAVQSEGELATGHSPLTILLSQSAQEVLTDLATGSIVIPTGEKPSFMGITRLQSA